MIGLLVGTGVRADEPPEQHLVEKVRQYASNFQMPDVAWDLTITSYQATAGTSHFHKERTSHTNRYAHNEVEYWRPARANGKPEGGSKWKPARDTRDNLFRAIAAETTTVVWDRWELLDGRRTAVFRFRVEQRDSDWILVEPGVEPVALPHSGLLWADPESGVILRISDRVTDFPQVFQTSSVDFVADYANVPIGTNTYMLPVHIDEINRRRDVTYRNVWESRNYHKFAVDSSITYEK